MGRRGHRGDPTGLHRGRSRECLQAGLGPLPRRPLERMAGRGPDDLPAAALRTLPRPPRRPTGDRKSTRLNSSHLVISYAVFCLKKKKKEKPCNIIEMQL